MNIKQKRTLAIIVGLVVGISIGGGYYANKLSTDPTLGAPTKIDISTQTNLEATSPVVLTNDTLSINLASSALEIDSTASISGAITLGNLISCDTIDSDANGLLSCGTDDSGGGSGMVLHGLLGDEFHSDVLNASASEGSLILGNNTPAWSELTIGASQSFLMSDGTTAFWADYQDIDTNTTYTATEPLSLVGTAFDIDYASGTSGGYLLGSDFEYITGHVASVNNHIDWTAESAGTIHATNYVDANTTYTGGTNLTLDGTEFNVDDPFAVAHASVSDDLTIGGVLALKSGGTLTDTQLCVADGTGGAIDCNVANNSANWDTAYGWGDWSGEGFITASASDFSATSADVASANFDTLNATTLTKGGVAVTTTGDFAKDIVAGTGITGAANDVLYGADSDLTLAFAPTELEAITWGANDGATIVWTWDVVGGDNSTITFGATSIQINDDLFVGSADDSENLSVFGTASISSTLWTGGLFTGTHASLSGDLDIGGDFNVASASFVTLSLNGTTVTTTGTRLNYLTSATGTTGTATTLLVFSTSPALTTPTVVTSIVGGATFAAFNTTTTTLTFGGAATTMTIGGTPTTAITHNYSTNATANATTKTINFGTGGVSGSKTNINIGSLTAGANGEIMSSASWNLTTGAWALDGVASTSGNWTINAGAWDLTNATSLKIPTSATLSLTANGMAGIDTTQGQLNYYSDEINVLMASTSQGFGIKISSTAFDLTTGGDTFIGEPGTIIGYGCSVAGGTNRGVEIIICDGTTCGDGGSVGTSITAVATGITFQDAVTSGTFAAWDEIKASTSDADMTGAVNWIKCRIFIKPSVQ